MNTDFLQPRLQLSRAEPRPSWLFLVPSLSCPSPATTAGCSVPCSSSGCILLPTSKGKAHVFAGCKTFKHSCEFFLLKKLFCCLFVLAFFFFTLDNAVASTDQGLPPFPPQHSHRNVYFSTTTASKLVCASLFFPHSKKIISLFQLITTYWDFLSSTSGVRT